jgi:hypothetical protein
MARASSKWASVAYRINMIIFISHQAGEEAIRHSGSRLSCQPNSIKMIQGSIGKAKVAKCFNSVVAGFDLH